MNKYNTLAAALAVAGSLLAGEALAEGPMDGAFGNTIVSTYANGTVGRSYLEPDGSYRFVSPEGVTSTGRWAVERKRLCYYAATAPNAPPLCTMGVNKKVGDTWKIFLPDGGAVKVELVAGRS